LQTLKAKKKTTI